MGLIGENFYNGGIYYNQKWVMDNYYYNTTNDYIKSFENGVSKDIFLNFKINIGESQQKEFI